MSNGFTFFASYYDVIKELDDDQQAIMYKAIMEYVFDDVEPVLDKSLSLLFILMRPNLDKSKNRSHKGIAGRKKSNGNQTEIKEESNENQTEINPKSNTSLDKDKERNGKDKDIYSARGRAREKKKERDPPEKNRFNRFPKHDYDFDEIKKKLISNG